MGLFEQLSYLPDESATSAIIAFQCREAHCLLELSNVDFNKTWAPALGKLSEQEWWQFGRIHFNPYPIPDSKESYQLIMERLNEQK